METKICPYLGIEEEKISHFDYPSTRNRCWQSGHPEAVDADHQGNYCLSLDYPACPIYSEPPPNQPEIETKSRRNWVKTSLLVSGIALSLVIILLAAAILIRPNFLPESINLRSQKIINGIRETIASISSDQSAPENRIPVTVDVAGYPEPGFNQNAISAVPTISPTIESNTPAGIDPYPVAEVDGADVAFTENETGEDEIITGTQTINRNPSSYGIRIIGDENVELESSYEIPENDRSEIIIDEQVITLIRDDMITYQHKGPGFLIEVENILARPDEEEMVKVSPDGMMITYQSGNANEISISLSYETDSGDWYFSVRNIDTLPGSKVVLMVDLLNETIEMTNEMYRAGEYNIEIARFRNNGVAIFLNSNIEIGPSETHLFELESLGKSDLLTLSKDNFSDGIIDRTTLLENSTSLHYLPLLTK